MPVTTALRLARVLGIIAALIFAVWYVNHRFTEWKDTLYRSGYQSGVNDTNLKWQTASTHAATQQLNQAIADAATQRAAINEWLDHLHQLVPALEALENRRQTYVQSPAGTAACLDADGVRIIQSQRAALGLGAGAGDPAGAAAQPTR